MLDRVKPWADIDDEHEHEHEHEHEQEQVISRDARVLAINTSAGIGKTTMATYEAIKRGLKIEVYMPTHELANEFAIRARDRHPRVSIVCIKGRARFLDDEKSTRMCERYPIIKDLNDKGINSLFKLMCKIGLEEDGGVCENYHKCPFIKQYEANAQITIYPHIFLGYPRSMLDKNKPGLAIIDEDFFGSIELGSEGVCRWKVKSLSSIKVPILATLADVLIKKEPLLPTLRKLYPNLAVDLKRLLKERKIFAPDIKPGMSDEDCSRAISNIKTNKVDVIPLLEVLMEAIDKDKVDTSKIWFDHSKEVVRISNVRQLDRLKNVPTLILDGTMNQGVVKHFFKKVEYHEIQVTRKFQGHTVQIYDSPFAKRRFNKDTNNKAESDLKDISKKLENLVSEYGYGLVVSYKDVVDKLILPSGCMSAYFGNLRGKNEWEHLNWVCVIGRHQLPVEAVENRARAHYGDDDPPLEITGTIDKKLVGYQLRGGWEAGMFVDHHQDERVQSFFNQTRESEVEQAIDRIRLLFSNKYKSVFLLTNLPVNVEVDTLMTFKQWVGEDKSTLLHKAWWEGVKTDHGLQYGVLPLNTLWLWNNVGFDNGEDYSPERKKRIVKQMFENAGDRAEIPYIYSIWNLGLTRYCKGKNGHKNRFLSIWGRKFREEILNKILDPVSLTLTEVGGAGGGGTDRPPPHIILTHTHKKPISQAALDSAYKVGLFRGGFCQESGATKGVVPGRYPLFPIPIPNQEKILTINVHASDGVLIVTANPQSRWVKDLIETCNNKQRPYHIVSPYKINPVQFRRWATQNQVEVMFVLGADNIKYADASRVFNSLFHARQPCRI